MDAVTSNQPKVGRSDSGFSTLLVPIKVKGKYLGCVFADGFILEETQGEQKVEVKNFLTRLFGRDADNLEAEIAKLLFYLKKILDTLLSLSRW